MYITLSEIRNICSFGISVQVNKHNKHEFSVYLI